MHIMRSILFLLLFAMPHNLQAIFIQAVTFIKGDRKIVCLGDDHTECTDSAAAKKQRDDLIKEAMKNNGHLIVEDIVYSGSDQILKQYYGKAIYLGILSPLFQLSTLAKRNKISSINIEFRFLKGMFYATTHEMLKTWSDQNEELLKNDFLTMLRSNGVYSTIMHEFHDQIITITRYNDNDILQKAYDDIIKDAGNFPGELEKLRKKCFANPTQANFYEFLETLRVSDTRLLDAKILHALYQYQSSGKKHILICAGAAHISNIMPVLKKMGFAITKKYYKTTTYVKKPSIKNRKIHASCAIDLDSYFNPWKRWLKSIGIGALLSAGAYSLFRLIKSAIG